MPPRKDVPLTVQEQRFVIHYIREGAAPEVAHIAERKARLKKGEGAKMLRRAHIQQEIHRRKVLIEFEENRLIAKDNVTQIQREDERDLVTLHKIEAALDKVIALDAEKHGVTVLKAIELGLIYTGSIRDGNKVKLSTIDPLGQDQNKKPDDGEMKPREDGFYTSIFANMKPDPHGGGQGGAPAAVEPAELMPAEDKPKPLPTVPVVQSPSKPEPKPKAKPESSAPRIEIT